jgi:protein-tyrosine phosphatase
VLTVAGVTPAEIAADYELSAERLPARYAARGEDDQGPLLAGYLAERGTTAGELIVATLAELDVEARLELTSADAERLRRRLLDP